MPTSARKPSVEQLGSSLVWNTSLRKKRCRFESCPWRKFALVVQLVERSPDMADVAGSSPVGRTHNEST